jgi:hypothetical protein
MVIKATTKQAPISAGNQVVIFLDPGLYTWSASIPGIGQAQSTASIEAGMTFFLTFGQK